MQEAFEKIKGVDIFSLKSYMEPTGFGSFNGVWVMINEILVNLFFFVLNAVVGFFSLFIRILEKIDLYSSYKKYVYDGAKSMWQNFTGSTSGGVNNASLIGILITILGIYLFFQYFFSRGNFSRRLLHACLVILLGFGYFGTVAGTSGGLYLLDTINGFSKEVSSKISNISVSYGSGKSVKVGDSVADSYIAETSYKAYVFANTGQENGKYKDTQTGKEENFDDSKVLGSTKDGKFTAVKSKDRQSYLDGLGDGANDDGEKNRWVSAVPDYIFIRLFYVIFKIVEAFVLAVPIIVIQMLNIIAQIIVLMMILLFPIILMVSFIPSLQDLIFGALKVMMGGLSVPAVTSLLTLMIFYIENIVESMITGSFDGVIKSLPSLLLFAVLFKLLISVVAKATVYFFLWKYKAELILFVLGSRASKMTNDIGDKVQRGMETGREVVSQAPQRTLETAQNLGNFALASAGYTAGTFMNAKEHFKNIGQHFMPNPQEPTFPSNPVTDDLPIIEPDTKNQPTQAIEDLTVTEPKVEPEVKQEAAPTDEFEDLKSQRISKVNQMKINALEHQLEAYNEPDAMFKPQGSNSFTRSFRKTMTPDQILQNNIERRDRLTQRLNQLRGN